MLASTYYLNRCHVCEENYWVIIRQLASKMSSSFLLRQEGIIFGREDGVELILMNEVLIGKETGHYVHLLNVNQDALCA